VTLTHHELISAGAGAEAEQHYGVWVIGLTHDVHLVLKGLDLCRAETSALFLLQSFNCNS
jgi:hypothetical protein